VSHEPFEQSPPHPSEAPQVAAEQSGWQQAPWKQTAPPLVSQTVPQVPQLRVSTLVSTHWLAHTVSPVWHDPAQVPVPSQTWPTPQPRPQDPQLNGSPERLAQ
jgi:hypothetical protein